MDIMTGKERISRILQRKPVDRIGLMEHFWSDTMKKWQGQGHIRQDENIADHFGFDIENVAPFKMIANVDYGDRLSFCGSVDARNLVANDLKAIKAELETKIPVAKAGSGYILSSDHSIPDACNYETYRYFIDEGLKLGTY